MKFNENNLKKKNKEQQKPFNPFSVAECSMPSSCT